MLKLTAKFRQPSLENLGHQIYDEKDPITLHPKFADAIQLSTETVQKLNSQSQNYNLTEDQTILEAHLSGNQRGRRPTLFLKIKARKPEDRSLYSFKWSFKTTLIGKEGQTLIEKITADKKYLRWLSYKKPINRGIFVIFEKESYILTTKDGISVTQHPNVGSYICTGANMRAELLGRDNLINLLSNKINYDSPMTTPDHYIQAKTTKITVRPIGTRLKPLIIEENNPLFQELLPLSYCPTLWNANTISNSNRRLMPTSPCYNCAHSCPHSHKGKAAVWTRIRSRQLQTNTHQTPIRIKPNWPDFPIRFFLHSKKYAHMPLPKFGPVTNKEWTLFNKESSNTQTWFNQLNPGINDRTIRRNQRDHSTPWPPTNINVLPSDPEILRNFHDKIQAENNRRTSL